MKSGIDARGCKRNQTRSRSFRCGRNLMRVAGHTTVSGALLSRRRVTTLHSMPDGAATKSRISVWIPPSEGGKSYAKRIPRLFIDACECNWRSTSIYVSQRLRSLRPSAAQRSPKAAARSDHLPGIPRLCPAAPFCRPIATLLRKNVFRKGI